MAMYSVNDSSLGNRIRLMGLADQKEKLLISRGRIRALYERPTDTKRKLTSEQRDLIGLHDTDPDPTDDLLRDIIDLQVERLGVKNWTGDEAAVDLMVDWFSESMNAKREDKLYTYALLDGQTYLLISIENGQPVWQHKKAAAIQVGGYHKAGTIQGMSLIVDNKDKIIFASDRFTVIDIEHPQFPYSNRLTLYYPDRIEMYVQKLPNSNSQEAGWVPWVENEGDPWPVPFVDLDGTPLGIPIARFENINQTSELTDSIISKQNGLNSSFADMLAISRIEGFSVLTASGITPSEKGELKFGPGKLFEFTDPNAKLVRVGSGDVKVPLDVAKFCQDCIGRDSRIPPYLLRAFGSSPVSGESLRQQQSAMSSMMQRKQRVLSTGWSDTYQITSKLVNVFSGRIGVNPDLQVNPIWKETITMSVGDRITLASGLREAGIEADQINKTVWNIEEGVSKNE